MPKFRKFRKSSTRKKKRRASYRKKPQYMMRKKARTYSRKLGSKIQYRRVTKHGPFGADAQLYKGLAYTDGEMVNTWHSGGAPIDAFPACRLFELDNGNHPFGYAGEFPFTQWLATWANYKRATIYGARFSIEMSAHSTAAAGTTYYSGPISVVILPFSGVIRGSNPFPLTSIGSLSEQRRARHMRLMQSGTDVGSFGPKIKYSKYISFSKNQGCKIACSSIDNMLTNESALPNIPNSVGVFFAPTQPLPLATTATIAIRFHCRIQIYAKFYLHVARTAVSAEMTTGSPVVTDEPILGATGATFAAPTYIANPELCASLPTC